jgi:hypothetical protein
MQRNERTRLEAARLPPWPDSRRSSAAVARPRSRRASATSGRASVRGSALASDVIVISSQPDRREQSDSYWLLVTPSAIAAGTGASSCSDSHASYPRLAGVGGPAGAPEICGSLDRSSNCRWRVPRIHGNALLGVDCLDDRPADDAAGLAGGEEENPAVCRFPSSFRLCGEPWRCQARRSLACGLRRTADWPFGARIVLVL